MAPPPISSLFVLHVGSNTGYAIGPLEELFFEAGLALAGGDPSRVHFSYRDFNQGKPSTLPSDFSNLTTFDTRTAELSECLRLANYASENQIELVVLFDMEPIHRLFRLLRENGVASIVGYWGAPAARSTPLWKQFAKRLMFQLSRSRMDSYIFESEAMADTAVFGAGIPRHRIDIVPLAVDVDLFHPGESTQVYDALGLPGDRRVIAYAGHMEPRKGVHSLVKAAVEILTVRKRQDVCFALFGDREGERLEYERMYANLGIEGLIRFGGYRSDLPEIYRGCYCGVIPSTGWDSFTTSSLEMAASGLPVIAARTGGLPEAVLDGVTGLMYQAGNVNELADSIELLLDNPDKAAELSRNARRRCEQEFTLEIRRERFLNVLRKRFRPE